MGKMRLLAATLITLVLTSVSLAQTTICWTGNENRWGGGSLTPTADDNFATNSATGIGYLKVSNGETYHHVYDQNVMAGDNVTVSMNRANNTLASVTLHGSSPATGFAFDTVGVNSDGLKLGGNVTVNSGTHVFNNSSNNLASLAANTIWNVASGAKLTWKLPLAESIPGLTLTKSGAGTLLFGGNITVGSTGTLLISAGAFGGSATLAGNLIFASGSKLQFVAADTLTIVSGRQASFSGPFGIADLAGLDSSVALGTYDLINGIVDFNHITNVGPAGAVLLGGGKRAYFENSGGLRLKVVADFPNWPRPTLRWAGFDQGRAVLSLEGLAPASYLGTVAKQFSDTMQAGIVLSQNPIGGSACSPGTSVDLVRSRGPEAGVVVFPNGPDFLNGEAIPVHRCVALARTLSGTILAFTEHRPNGKDDEDDMDIHLRRSTDGGETWGPVIVVADDSMNPCKNQVPVVLPSGRILMLWLWNAWIPSEADRSTREVYVTHSDDDGLTWAPHTNITSQVYQAGWDWYGMGPGHAFVKTRAPNAGRIIFPSRHGVVGGAGKPHIIYTDDKGATFHLGGELNDGNESTACEQSDGDILFNVRGGPVLDYRYSDIAVINAAGDVGIIGEFGSHYSKPARWDGGVKYRAITFGQINQPVP